METAFGEDQVLEYFMRAYPDIDNEIAELEKITDILEWVIK